MQLLTDPVTGAQSPRNIDAYLSGPVGAETTRVATRVALRDGNWFDSGLRVFPEPSDNTSDDFGVQSGGGFSAELAAMEGVDTAVTPTDLSNLFALPYAAANQTITLGIGTYCIWFMGLGTITVAAGTASITGAGASTANGAGLQSTPRVFTVTAPGTVTLTLLLFYSDSLDPGIQGDAFVGFYA